MKNYYWTPEISAELSVLAKKGRDLGPFIMSPEALVRAQSRLHTLEAVFDYLILDAQKKYNYSEFFKNYLNLFND